MSDSTPPLDGGTPPTQPDGGAGDQQAIRNIDDLKRVAAERDKYKAQYRKIQELIAGEGQKPPDGQNLSEVLQTLMANQKAMEQRTADAERQAADATAQNQQLKTDMQQRALADTILSGVPDQHRDAVKLMIPGVLAEKKIDLSTTEDAKADGKKCREMLSARFPNMFGEPGSNSGGGSPSAPRKSYENVSWADLSDDEKRSMSPEDFAKHFSGGGVREDRASRGALLRKR